MFYQRLRAELQERQQSGNLRELPMVNFTGSRIVLDSVPYVDLSSNDYLSIARDPKIFSTFIRNMMDTNSTGSEFAGQFLLSAVSAGSTGSRLLTGNHPSYAYFEDLLSALYNNASDELDVPSLDDLIRPELNERSFAFDNNEEDFNASAKKVSCPDGNCQRKPHCGCEIKDYQALVNQDHETGYEAPKIKERACLYINSGFDANDGILSTLFGDKDLLLVDKLAHASIIDGMLRSKAKSLRYAHNDMEHLERLLEQHHNDYETVVIVTESIFSMDGDRAKLKEIVALKERYHNVLIYVDEAHSFGLLGHDGLGLCKELNLVDKVDFIMGTLSKAIGSQGAFLICSKEVKDYLVNFMRPLIFATALPPVNVSFSLYIVGLLGTVGMKSRRKYLKEICAYFHASLKDLDLNPSQSQIQPLITGSSDKALKASQIFKEAGLLAMPIRYPTVPQKLARLRLSLNCSLRIDDLERIIALIKRHRSLFL